MLLLHMLYCITRVAYLVYTVRQEKFVYRRVVHVLEISWVSSEGGRIEGLS